MEDVEKKSWLLHEVEQEKGSLQDEVKQEGGSI
ncbi:hypothetical protein ISN45_At03g028050 [Arabidopsis thaliana x Arabidopsis arenosa]|uniref:Uncharacterized protein n=2 Tax=Arabidopsis TaxID=3701 RepID=A0A8T2F917_ARASU|nr:hypothetical protein ISN45_At03g028050 [Arabidopsis thaliana x Arabidopsis arenosa]KAG7632647.1 hypothetical protein ISN44_As03g027740 [Arabidopsis suecica]